MILASFRAQYPEFRSVPDALVQTFLDTATVRLDATVWGSDLDQGIGLKAAALLAMSPNGMGVARMADDPTRSTYEVEFERMTRIVATGLRVF